MRLEVKANIEHPYSERPPELNAVIMNEGCSFGAAAITLSTWDKSRVDLLSMTAHGKETLCELARALTYIVNVINKELAEAK